MDRLRWKSAFKRGEYNFPARWKIVVSCKRKPQHDIDDAPRVKRRKLRNDNDDTAPQGLFRNDDDENIAKQGYSVLVSTKLKGMFRRIEMPHINEDVSHQLPSQILQGPITIEQFPSEAAIFGEGRLIVFCKRKPQHDMDDAPRVKRRKLRNDNDDTAPQGMFGNDDDENITQQGYSVLVSTKLKGIFRLIEMSQINEDVSQQLPSQKLQGPITIEQFPSEASIFGEGRLIVSCKRKPQHDMDDAPRVKRRKLRNGNEDIAPQDMFGNDDGENIANKALFKSSAVAD